MALHAKYDLWTVALQSCLVLLAGITLRFCISLYHVRHKFQMMQKAGLVSLPQF